MRKPRIAKVAPVVARRYPAPTPFDEQKHPWLMMAFNLAFGWTVIAGGVRVAYLYFH